MTNSMTGFARVESTTEAGQLTVEFRSVNHRYLEQNLRMPEELRAFEPKIREQVQQSLARGKVDCSIRFNAVKSGATFNLNREKVQALLSTLESLENEMKNPARITSLDVLGWPGIIEDEQPDQDVLAKAVFTAVNDALEALIKMRAQEGARLATLVEQRLQAIDQIVDDLKETRAQIVSAIRDKLLARIEHLEIEFDSNRLEQEIALIAQKLDVDEELDRLKSHIKATRETLKKKEPVGRKLDFLMQEFNREANTLSSKSANSETTAAAVELKVLTEQMREQVQNIE